MEYPIARRQFLAIGAGGLASLAGCQSNSGSKVSTLVHITNSTEQSQDAYLELTRPDDENFQIGRVLSLEEGLSERVTLSLPPGAYQVKFNIDDVEPRPEKTVEWEVTDVDCAKERYWTVVPSDTGLNLKYTKPDCDDS